MVEFNSRQVLPPEARSDAQAMLETRPNDVLVWLRSQRDLEAADREEAFAANDLLKANRHDERSVRFATAVTELEKLRDQNYHLTIAIRNTVLVALTDAQSPPWQATHRHYKGGLYRVTGTPRNAETDEPVDSIAYDDAQGNKFVMSKARWESHLDSGKPRYQVLYKDEK